MILVTGARGNVGSRIVEMLAGAGYRVRATARDTSALRVPAGVEAARLDLTDDRVAAAVLEDVETVFLYPTRGSAAPFLEAAREAGVQHVVLLSSPASYEAAEYRLPIGRIHQAVEKAVADSGLEHTVLYPSWLATNVRRDWGAAIRAGDPVEVPYPAAQCNPIHLDDVAEVAVELLTRDRHRGRFHILTGPEPMRLDEAVGIVAGALRRPIPVVEITREEAMRRRQPWMSEQALSALLDSAAASVGHPAAVNNTVERITGHPARTLHDWMRDNMADFTP